MKTIRFQGNKNIISEMLKELREKFGLTQSELAVKLQLMDVCIDQQAISKIELNRRIVTDYELLCFAKIFGVDVAYLLNGDSWFSE